MPIQMTVKATVKFQDLCHTCVYTFGCREGLLGDLRIHLHGLLLKEMRKFDPKINNYDSQPFVWFIRNPDLLSYMEFRIQLPPRLPAIDLDTFMLSFLSEEVSYQIEDGCDLFSSKSTKEVVFSGNNWMVLENTWWALVGLRIAAVCGIDNNPDLRSILVHSWFDEDHHAWYSMYDKERHISLLNKRKSMFPPHQWFQFKGPISAAADASIDYFDNIVNIIPEKSRKQYLEIENLLREKLLCQNHLELL